VLHRHPQRRYAQHSTTSIMRNTMNLAYPAVLLSRCYTRPCMRQPCD
jgi:hypothetical protein